MWVWMYVGVGVGVDGCGWVGGWVGGQAVYDVPLRTHNVWV